MQKTTCDGGCGATESTSLPDSRKEIRRVKLVISNDQRESMTNEQEKHEADLCKSCRVHLVTKFFRAPALDGGLFREEREPIMRAAS